MRFLPIAVTALVVGVLGPALTMPRDKPAGAPFVYEPPEGFVERADLTKKSGPDQPGLQHAWSADHPEAHVFPARITVSHSPSQAAVSEEDLRRLAEGMPEVHEALGWTLRRYAVRTRPDGARVGIIEGDCVGGREMWPGLPETKVRFRMNQMVFPDDGGTSIVTAMFGADEEAKLAPVFDASIDRARGVAKRGVPISPFVYMIWGVGGAVLGWFAVSIFGKKRQKG